MEALGPILLVLAIPLSLRWIPRNRFFGLRIPATIGFVGVLSAVTADWRTANRLRREREAIPGTR